MDGAKHQRRFETSGGGGMPRGIKARWIQTTGLGSVAAPSRIPELGVRRARVGHRHQRDGRRHHAGALATVISGGRRSPRTVGRRPGGYAADALLVLRRPPLRGVYERTRRLGPSLALMLAAPALNLAVLTVTFLLSAGTLEWTRLAVSLLLVIPVGRIARPRVPRSVRVGGVQSTRTRRAGPGSRRDSVNPSQPSSGGRGLPSW